MFYFRRVLLAVIACVTSFSVIADEAIDVSGTWQFEILDTGRTFTPSFVLKQDGARLTGTYKNSQGDNPASGTVKGNEVTLNAEIVGRDGNKRTVTYIGKVNGDAMAGKMETTRADVTFTAKRLAQ